MFTYKCAYPVIPKHLEILFITILAANSLSSA